MERTLVLIKPDGVKRGLAGKILERYERVGLKIIGLKMVWVDRDKALGHYIGDEYYLRSLGEKCLKAYEEYGLDPVEYVGSKDPIKVGGAIREWTVNYIISGPVIALALEGNHAIDNARMITGNTYPTFALPGTIRGDFSIDSAVLANTKKRAVKNLIHASGSKEEAGREVKYWFKEEELHSYTRADEEEMF